MNPLSAIQICNSALIFLGSGYSIDSFEDEDPAGRACRIQYPIAVRTFLDNDHPYSFATTRAYLAPISGRPNWYQLPSDMIKPISLADDERTPYHIEMDKLYTTAANPELIYVVDSQNLAWFPPKAISAIQYLLAANLAIILKQDEKMATTMQQMALRFIDDVIKSDIKNLQMPDIQEYSSSLYEAR